MHRRSTAARSASTCTRPTRATAAKPTAAATVVTWRETPFFTERERAALEWTEALTLVASNHVPDAVWEAVKPHFTDEELFDLSMLIATINSWNRFAIAFRKMPE